MTPGDNHGAILLLTRDFNPPLSAHFVGFAEGAVVQVTGTGHRRPGEIKP